MSDPHRLQPLLDQVLAGNSVAVETLLAKLRPYLHLLVRQHLEPDLRQKLGDSDIVQETLVRINGALNPALRTAGGSFQGQAAPEFLAWISQIVRHVIVDLERYNVAKKRDKRREVPGVRILAMLAQGSTPAQASERAERTLIMAAAVERLSQHKQDILRLRFVEQLSFEEISKRTGKGVNAVRVLCCRALKDLRADGELLGLMEVSS